MTKSVDQRVHIIASREEGSVAASGKEEEEEEEATSAADLVARPLTRPRHGAVSALAQDPYSLVGKVLVTVLAASHLPQMEYVFFKKVGFLAVGVGISRGCGLGGCWRK